MQGADGGLNLVWQASDDHGSLPRRRGTVWSLSRKGQQWIATHEQAPLTSMADLRSILDHDTMVSEVLVRALELAQPLGLSRVYLERETRLDPERPRPKADAILPLRRRRESEPPLTIPWTLSAPCAGEHIRAYVIEGDRATEPISSIAAKAAAYLAINRSRRWQQHFGKFPVPLWVVPTERGVHVATEQKTPLSEIV